MNDTGFRRPTLVHQPGLDGLRGLAVALVVLFHADISWMSGGFLGVSIFFTLSGYLITSLLLAEHEQRGRIDLRNFWSRRLRRLAPASLAAIVVVVALASWLSTSSEASRIKGDAVSAALYVSNWRFVVAEHSYADLFSAPSPLLHIWSLSIEEQLYVVVPLLVVGVLALGWSRRRLGVVLLALAATSTITGVAVSGVDRVYYGTDTRAAELLLGAVLACFVSHRLTNSVSAQVLRLASGAGSLALLAVIALSITSDTRSGWVAGGALPAFALLSIVLVVASVVVGPIRSLLSFAPLRALGRISYGVYLVHWPVFVFLSENRLGFGGVGRIVLCVAITLSIAMASHRWFERPIRDGRRLVDAPRALSAFAVGVVVSVVLPLVVLADGPGAPSTTPVVLVTTTSQAPTDDITDDGNESPATSTVPDERSLTLLVIGDSTANNVARALADTGDTDLGVVDAGVIGCPLVLATRVFDVPGGSRDATYCPFPAALVRDTLDWTAIDAIVIAVGPPSRWSYRDLSGTLIEPGTEAYAADLERTMDALVEVADGRPIVVFDAPYVRNDDEVLGDDPELVDFWNEVVDRWGERDEVDVFEYSSLFAPAGSELDREQRPDGVHLEREYAAELARSVIVPELRELISSRRPL
jgi:peptidoglycan/LPS O-acetylase OafA/YrhL